MSDTPVPESSTPTAAVNQLSNLPRQELDAIAEEFGLDPTQYKETDEIVAAIQTRRNLIATLDRAAMQDVLDWAGRTLPPMVSNEQLAIEIAKIKSMRFNHLSDRGLVVLAQLRGVDFYHGTSRDDILYALKSQEGFFAKLKRKTRGWMGKRVEKMIGDETTTITPATPVPENKATDQTAAPRQQALREEIEESGFFGGIANRVKKQADSYVNQKLDEIEARIDRKLDEIDRRLAEWRDKEIANRIRILKITLWASVVVAAVSLVYSYIQVERDKWLQPRPNQTTSIPSTMPTNPSGPTNTIETTDQNTATRTNRLSGP